MGMAASQARLLTLTARLADNELRSQTINNAKMRLAAESSQVSNEYVNALNSAQYVFNNTDMNGMSQQTALNFNALSSYSPYNTQYGLVNSSGLLLVSEKDADNFKAAGGDLNKFLEKYGLKWDTTYFDNEGNGDSNSKFLATNLGNVYAGNGYERLFTTTTPDGTTKMTNEELKDLYEKYQRNSLSLESANYSKLSTEFYNQYQKLYKEGAKEWAATMFGDNVNDFVNKFVTEYNIHDLNQLKTLLIGSTTTTDNTNNTNYTYTYANQENSTTTTTCTTECQLNTNNTDVKKLGAGTYLTGEGKSAIGQIVRSFTAFNFGKNSEEYKEYAAWCDVLANISSGIKKENNDYYFCGDNFKLKLTVDPDNVDNVFEVNTEDSNEYLTLKKDALASTNKNIMVDEFEFTGNTDSIEYKIIGNDGVAHDMSDYGKGKTIDRRCLNYFLSNLVRINKDTVATTTTTTTTTETGTSTETTTTTQTTTTYTGYEVYGNNVSTKDYIEIDYGNNSNDAVKEACRTFLYSYCNMLTSPLSYSNATGENGEDIGKDCINTFDVDKYGSQDTEYIIARNKFFNFIFDERLDESGNTKGPLTVLNNNKNKKITNLSLSGGEILNLQNFLFANYNNELDDTTQNHFYEFIRDGQTFSNKFNNLLDAKAVELMIEEFGEPRYTWIDSTDPSGVGNAEVKAQWYTNLFNRMSKGYKTLEDGLASSREWIQYAFESGLVTMEQVDSTNYWTPIDYKSCASITEATDVSDKIAKAEAKYKRAMNDIKAKDQIFDMQLKNIDTEHQALQTEYDVVKKVMDKNIDRTFKFNQNG